MLSQSTALDATRSSYTVASNPVLSIFKNETVSSEDNTD